MTSISPLSNVVEKGLKGNHENKNEENLIKISEIKNLLIVQIVQYKNSTISIEDISCLLYTSPIPRDGLVSRIPSSA